MGSKPIMAAALLALVACKDKEQTQAAKPVLSPSPVAPAKEQLAEPNNPPVFPLPAWERAGVGQRISFGVAPIDIESDRIRVDLVEKPASATYDPMSLTVAWTPTAADMPAGRFSFRVTETAREGGATRTFVHPFAIEVTRQKQPAPTARPLGDIVELVLTIHDRERLATVNEMWPFDRMLLRGAELEYSKMDEKRRAKVTPPSADALYRSYLKAMADLHKAPKLDPDSPAFDPRFADPKGWELIALRPRIDKRYHELRVVYRHATADEDIVPMFRFRILKDGPTPEEGRVFNNKAFEQIVADAFFDADGKLRRDLVTDKQAHARATADMTTKILTFADPERPWAQGHFISMPHGGRLGGGSERDADGNYAYGDGWAWGVMRPLYKEGRATLEFENVGFPGFVTELRPSSDGTTWDTVCGARWNPDDPSHEPGMEAACMKDLGTVGLPERTKEGTIIRSATDTTHRFLDYKLEHAVATVPIDDPRRDVHEEQGMSCHQCHVRAFGIRDVYDEAAVNPAAGMPVRRNKRLAPTFFVVVPMQRWEPYAIDFQHLQECMAAENLPKYLGRKLELGCPLRAE